MPKQVSNKMTRMHFELIADVIKGLDFGPEHTRAEDYQCRQCVEGAFAGALKATNPSFDMHKFLVACGVTPP